MSWRNRTGFPIAATSARLSGRNDIAFRVLRFCSGFGSAAKRSSWRPIIADHDTMLSAASTPPG